MSPVARVFAAPKNPVSLVPIKRCDFKSRPINLLLGLVTNRASVADEGEFLYRAIQAIKGGASYIQLRDRNKDVRACIQAAYRLKQLTAHYGVSLLINNRVDVALAVGADGVHLGQKDFPVYEARKLLGEKAIIGLTVGTIEDVRAAET